MAKAKEETTVSPVLAPAPTLEPAPAPVGKPRYRVSLKNVQADDRFDVIEADDPNEAYQAWKAARGIRGSKHKPEVKLEV